METKSISLPTALYLPIKPEHLRKITDPTNQFETYYALCPVEKVPDIPVEETNPREQNLKSKVAREIQNSLLNLDGNFHLLNRGITISVNSAGYDNKTERLRIDLEKPDLHGNVDGGHTQRVIRETVGSSEWEDARQQKIEIGEELKQQYVRYEIITGLSPELLVSLAEARNTSAQVKEFALDNLAKKFEWLKQQIPQFESVIVYRENEKKPVNVRDVIALLTLFNVALFPNNGSQYPTQAYSSKAKPLELFDEKQESYRSMRPIILEILELYDYVRARMKDVFNEQGGKFLKWEVVDQRSATHFHFAPDLEPVPYRVPDGLVYPLLGAFRFLVRERKGEMVWKVDDTKKFYDRFGERLIRNALETVRLRGNNPNAAGKDASFWEQLYNQVKLAYFELQDIDENRDVQV
jgi:hypothetical protein